MDDSYDEARAFLRFEKLVDLANQLSLVAERRHARNAAWKVGFLARPLLRQSRQKGWELTHSDVRWLINRVEGTL